MKKLSIAFALILSLSSQCYAQKQVSEKKISADSCVTILVTPAEKAALLLELNGKLFLASMKDIQSFDPKIISTIQMYEPKAKECSDLIQKSKIDGVELQKVFKIETKEGMQLPDRFLEKEK